MAQRYPPCPRVTMPAYPHDRVSNGRRSRGDVMGFAKSSTHPTGITVTVHLTWPKQLGQKAFNKRHHASFEQ